MSESRQIDIGRKVVMQIRAPRGSMRLYAPEKEFYSKGKILQGRYNNQVELIRAFMRQHNETRN